MGVWPSAPKTEAGGSPVHSQLSLHGRSGTSWPLCERDLVSRANSWDVALWVKSVGSGFRPQYVLNWVLRCVLRILDAGVCLLIVSQGRPGLHETLSQNREGRSDSGRRFSVKQISLSLPLVFLMLLKCCAPIRCWGHGTLSPVASTSTHGTGQPCRDGR